MLAILGAILASALFSRWMIGLLQGYKRDLDAHALALEQKAGELHLAGHVFESSKEGILITDAERRILAVNPAFTAISGYRAEEVVGKQPDLLASGITVEINSYEDSLFNTYKSDETAYDILLDNCGGSDYL